MTLENSLSVTLISDPDASRAAALFQLSAGSHQEPVEWPGLAHLLEHVLFADSLGFRDEQRLMAWAAAQGATLNATTLANQTAWFFEVAVGDFAAGLARLVDMLANPLLAAQAIANETAVIDAEYRMLSRHIPMLRDAALSSAFAHPHPFHDFHVGSQASFGDDRIALRRALQHYHQHFFRPQNLHLWLLGPQPLAELAGLAKHAGKAFPAAWPATPARQDLHLSLCPERSFALNSQRDELLLSFPVTGVDRRMFSVLRTLLNDQADKSLLASLQGRCDDIQLLEPYRSTEQSLLSVVFQLTDASHSTTVEALFHQWCIAATGLTDMQLTHYVGLAQRRFAELAPGERLRMLAFGFAPAAADDPAVQRSAWHGLVAQLVPHNLTRLKLTQQDNLPFSHAQGFRLQCGPVSPPIIADVPATEFVFFSPGAPLPLPVLPTASASLLAFFSRGETTLLLSTLPGHGLSGRHAATFAVALQPVIAACQHRGGDLRFSQQQGNWLLQLSGSGEMVLTALAHIIDALISPSAAVLAQAERTYQRSQQARFDDVAVRCLLDHLTGLLSQSASEIPPSAPHGHPQNRSLNLSDSAWQAVLYGNDDGLNEKLSRVLSRFPGRLCPDSPRSTPQSPKQASYSFPTRSNDAAVIVFCTLPECSVQDFAALQILATCYQPRFFTLFREEMKIGYVVSCRFQQLAGESGLLFALQSPSVATKELYQHIIRFVQQMSHLIAALSPAALREKITLMQHMLSVTPPTHPAGCVQHWLQQPRTLPPITAEIYQQVTATTLNNTQRRVEIAIHQCWYLHNLPNLS